MAIIPPVSLATANENLKDLDHLFVVMMENRSFDQMLGYRRIARPAGILDADVDGLTGNEGEFLGTDASTRAFERVFHETDTLFDEDPPHFRKATIDSLAGFTDKTLFPGTRFADRCRASLQTAKDSGKNRIDPKIARRVLGYYAEEEVPMMHHFAENFTICDRWFSSTSGSTWANRLFLYYGCSGNDDQPLIDNIDMFEFDDRRNARQADREDRKEKLDDLDLKGHDKREERRDMRKSDRDERKDAREEKQETQPRRRDYRQAISTPSIFDLMDAAGQSWGVYHDGLVPWKMLLPHQHFGGKHGRVRKLSTLNQDIRQGDLPKLVFLDPDFDLNPNDDHVPIDAVKGQRFLKRIYDLVTENAAVFKRSALVITWDEHVGFYDHVDPRNFPTGDVAPFEHYGVRVPAIVAGGRFPARAVSKLVFDHTSVMATALRAFAPGQLPKAPERVRNAKHLGFLMTEPERPSFPAAPEVKRIAREATKKSDLFRTWMRMTGVG